MRIACDTGGTFTDLIVEEDGVLQMFKTSTVPSDPVKGVLNGLELIAKHYEIPLNKLLKRVDTFIHATTRSINAVLTGNTAKTAFFVTKGHKDILLLREGGRTDPFNFSNEFPKPFVPRSLTYEIDERITSQGKVLKELDEESVKLYVADCLSKSIESIGVCLLWSISNSAHEEKIEAIIKSIEPSIPVTLSSRLNPSLREYRRASSACIDASLKPLMFEYLDGLERRMREAGFMGEVLMVTSQGGIMEASEVARAPIHSLGSGPAMAPLAGSYYAKKASSQENVIIADTGGTSYDVSLVRGGVIPWTRETWIGEKFQGHMTGFPSVDVRSIGAGGGSIAWVDSGGLLHVGPKSAGSTPGPVCYGLGGKEPTVTDCSLVLGIIDPSYFLGGAMVLDKSSAIDAINENLASKLGLSIEESALAVLSLATEKMVGAIEGLTVNQGIDPQTACLVGGGGAAGLNANIVAKRLGCPKAIIPGVGAVLSAAGALMSDLSAEYASVFVTNTEKFEFDKINNLMSNLKKKCQEFIDNRKVKSINNKIEYFVEARYPQQIWEIDTPFSRDQFKDSIDVKHLAENFHSVHNSIFQINDKESHVEFVNWRAKVSCRIKEKVIDKVKESSKRRDQEIKYREVFFDKKGSVQTPVIPFDHKSLSEILKGPAIIESPFTTVLVEPGSSVSRDEIGSLVINID